MFPDLMRDDVFRLETRRLWLRWPRAADVPGLAAAANNPAIAAMTARLPHPYGDADADAFVLEARTRNAAGRSHTLTIAERAKPTCPIGTVAIEWPDNGAPSLGYWIAAPSWDKGYATEAARALVDAFFAYAAGERLVAHARVINPASRRVLEKCGFSAIGSGLRSFPARGGLLPVDEFRLERRAWASFKAWSHAGLVAEPPPSSACTSVPA